MICLETYGNILEGYGGLLWVTLAISGRKDCRREDISLGANCWNNWYKTWLDNSWVWLGKTTLSIYEKALGVIWNNKTSYLDIIACFLDKYSSKH